MSVMGAGYNTAYYTPNYLAERELLDALRVKVVKPKEDIVDCVDVEVVSLNPLDKQVGGDHYKGLSIQPTEYIMKNNLGWCEANAIKYITRYKQKGQKKDIEKAIHYLEILLDQLGD